MQIEEFTLERIQSLYENTVELNLSDSGVHPYSLRQLLTPDELAGVLDVELGYGWTNGGVELRRTIAALYAGRSADEIIVTNGSAEANFLMVMTLLEPGDEIIMVTPNYLQIRGWARATGVGVREIRLREELGWLPDIAEIAAAVTPRTRAVTLSTPNNPTGRVVPEPMLQDLVALSRRHGLWLHADEVYRGSEYGVAEAPSVADLYEKAIVTNGLSKAMALPGLRIGWLVGPAGAIADAWHRKDYTSITTGAVSERVAELVLQPDRRRTILQRSRELLSDNVERLKGWAAKNQDLFSLVPPEAGGMAFVKYAMPVNSTAFVHGLRQAKSVMLAPGDVYGLDGFVRIGVGALPDALDAGLERIAAYARSSAA